MSEPENVVQLENRAPRNREGYVDPPTSFADDIVDPAARRVAPVLVPIARRPMAARDANPRLSAPLLQTVHTVPAGQVARYRWRDRKSKAWEEWSTRAGPCTIRVPLACDLSEFHTAPAGVPVEVA